MIPKYGVAILLVLLAATSLRATTRATDYPGSISMLLGVESVRSDLALDAKQKSRLNVLRKELRSKSQVLTQKKSKVPLSRLTADQKLFSLIDTNNSGALAVLTPEQSVRFHEIQNQALGFTMLVSPKVQKQLVFGVKQVISIEKIRLKGLDFVAETNLAFEEGKLSQDKRLQLLRDYRSEQADDFKAVLTRAQREAFTALCGQPLKR
jgi:hypothetical protein